MAPAERLRLLEIFARRYEHAAFRLDRFEDESGETPGREPARQFAEVAEGDRFGVGQHRAKALAPEGV